MSNSKVIEQLIAAIFHVFGRSALPVAQVRELVGRTEKNRKAFNMCDGRNTQQEISRRLRIDQGQLSKSFARWIESGIAFRIGDESESRLLHIYPIPPDKAPRTRSKRNRRASRR